MYSRSVFVLVFMCCVNSWAQWEPNNSPDSTYEHPGMFPNGIPPQSSTIPNSPERLDILYPEIMTVRNGYSGDSHYPLPEEMLPQHGPSSGLSDQHKNPNIYPHYDSIPEFSDTSNNPHMQHPSPGFSDEPGNADIQPQAMPPPFDPSSRFPESHNNLYPQGELPHYDPSSGYSDNSDNLHLQPQGTAPPNDPSRYPYIIVQSQGRPPPSGPSPDPSIVPEIPHINPQEIPPRYHPSPGIPDIREHQDMHPHKIPPPFGPMPDYPDDRPHQSAPVMHAGLPRKLEVFPLPLENSDHELKFNVSWIPSMRNAAIGYSLEVWSLTQTDDCQPRNSPTNLPMCYEYVAGNVTWSLIPALSSTIVETCTIRPGCSYNVKLLPHPWDGHTSANLLVELDECVVGVCSCAHSPRLPVPVVSARSVTIEDKMYTNITWTLPSPSYPQRLPSAILGKQRYIVNLAKQMVSEALPSPLFFNIMTADVTADGLVSKGNAVPSVRFPISQQMELKVKLLARVKLVDERGCVGPEGNAVVFDPEEVSMGKFSFGVYAILGALIGAWAMGAVFVLSARVVKRVLKSFRPAPVSAPLESLSRRPAWFPLQLRT